MAKQEQEQEEDSSEPAEIFDQWVWPIVGNPELVEWRLPTEVYRALVAGWGW